jgi:hypothetical protein
MLREHAGNHIRLTTGAEWHDNFYDAIGVVLRGCSVGSAQDDDSERHGDATLKRREACHGHAPVRKPEQR